MKKRKRIGLALGSGSARGWSHIGVVRCLREADIPIDIVCGASMGAVVGGCWAAGFLGEMETLVRELRWPDIFRFLEVRLPRSGFMGGDKITAYLKERLTDLHIEDLPVAFGAVASDLYSGKEIWLRKGSLIDAMRASISVPVMFTPYPEGTRWLLDGGLVNPVPVSLCRAMGADIVIAVSLNSDILGKSLFTRERRRRNQVIQEKVADFLDASMPWTNPSAWLRSNGNSSLRGPTLLEVITRSLYIMQDRITRQRLQAEPPDVLITPHLADIALFEFNRGAEAIDEGYRSASLVIPLIRDRMT
ncbi:MAG TPA: patatin-like phospholipase family protein [Syntrophales bacterium]|nr:patatin-like phospholipase family protein [Syntrophales bacterium]